MVGVAALAAVALVAVALLLRNDDGSSTSSGPVVDISGIPQAGSVLGDPAAKVTLIEFADMQCPFCKEFSEQMLPTLVSDYVRPGKLKSDFKVVSILGDDSEKAARFVIAAGLQGRLWQFQERLYARQGAENSGWVTDDLVREVASGIPGLDVDKLFADKDSAEVTSALGANHSAFDTAGAQGTPTVLIKIGDQPPYMVQVGLDPTALSAALDDALQG